MSSGREKRRPDGEPRDHGFEPDGPDAGAPGAELKFFLAVFQSGIREARIYRAYPDPDGVSFVYTGPAPLFLDLDVARGKGHGDWKVKTAQSLKTGIVSAAGTAGVVLGLVVLIVGRMVIRGGARVNVNVTDIIGLL